MQIQFEHLFFSRLWNLGHDIIQSVLNLTLTPALQLMLAKTQQRAPLHSDLYSQYDTLVGHAALLLSHSLPLLPTCLPSSDDQTSLVTANISLVSAYLSIVLVSGGHWQVSDCIPSYEQMFPPGWCLVTTMEERHSHLWRQIADTTMDKGEMVLVLHLLLFSPDSESLALHLSDSARRRVEEVQEHWARQAHSYCKQGYGKSGGVGYRTRLGEICMTIAKVRELVEIEELRLEGEYKK